MSIEQYARRFGAVDVHYPPEGGARAALVVAASAEYAEIVERRRLARATTPTPAG
ncbi:MAG TPA: hypothetical protein VHA75_08610 [Rugosimonospora sp.]|nr:hypothetical protein [Rugosimonospora sp.]